MRLSIIFLFSFFSFPINSIAQSFEWLQWSPNSGQNSDYDNFNAIATDPFGNTFMAVQFTGVLDIGEYSFQSNPIEDICILKYDVNGEFLWAKAMGSLYWDQVNGMDCDENGNLYLTGHYFNVFWFDNDSLIGNAGGREMFLMKLLPDGQVDWVVNGANPWDEEGTDVRAMPGGGVVMSGRARNTAYIGNLQLDHPEYLMQEFIAYFDDNGVGQWIRSGGPTGASSLFYSNAKLEIGPDSSIFMGYSGSDDIILNGDTIRPWYYPEISYDDDLILQRWSSEGEPLWGWVGGAIYYDFFGDIGVDSQGRLYASMACLTDYYFSDNLLSVETGYRSQTVLRWNEDGTEDTAWHWLSSGSTVMQSLVCDAQDNTWIGGLLRDSMYISSGTIYPSTEIQRHGILFRLNGETNTMDHLNLITGNGWRTVSSLEYNEVSGSIMLGGDATASNQNPAIFGLGEDIVEDFNDSGNWAYLASYNNIPCESAATLLVSDSTLCPNESADIAISSDMFFAEWSDGSTDDVLTIDTPTNVALTAIDSTGCIQYLQASVSEAIAVEFEGSITNLQCNGSADGAVEIDVLSGTAASFDWSSGQDTEDVSGLNAGNYVLDVTSEDDCVTTHSFSISQPQPINGNITELNGVLTLGNLSGGTPPYTYEWNEFDNETGMSVNITEAGSYSVTITDANGCTALETIQATDVTELSDAGIVIAPNPSRGVFTMRIDRSINSKVDSYTIESVWGNKISEGRLISNIENVQLSVSGVYFIRLWNAEGRLVRTARVIVE